MHRASFLSFPLATSILLGALGAQERRTALSLLPGKPMLVMQAAGPARIALAFKDTNIAKMLGGE